MIVGGGMCMSQHGEMTSSSIFGRSREAFTWSSISREKVAPRSTAHGTARWFRDRPHALPVSCKRSEKKKAARRVERRDDAREMELIRAKAMASKAPPTPVPPPLTYDPLSHGGGLPLALLGYGLGFGLGEGLVLALDCAWLQSPFFPAAHRVLL